MKKRSTVEKIIRVCRQQNDIEEVTIIEGFTVHYSGDYAKFFAECDPSMVLFRNKLLRRNVLNTCMLANRKLFIFLASEEDSERSADEYYCNCCGWEFTAEEGTATDGETTWIRCPICSAERYTEEEDYIIEKIK